MQAKLVIKFCVAAAIGVLGGWFIHIDYERWHRLGREAFLSYQARRFDLYMADPQLKIVSLFVFAVLTLGLFAFYEVVSYAVARTTLRFSRVGKGTSSGIAGSAPSH
jgi:hypothetical protein